MSSSFRPSFTQQGRGRGRGYNRNNNTDGFKGSNTNGVSGDRDGYQHNNGNRVSRMSTRPATPLAPGEVPVLSLKNSLSQISFCDRECYNINSDRTKEAIINYVQNKHKIRIIDRQYVTLDNNKMRNISHHEHLVATYSNGNPYLLLLTKIDETPCCIFIDRKCKEGYNYPKMHAVQYQFAPQLFDRDTLFTGELIRDINREWQFLIADLLVYEGVSTREKNILTRFEIINNILDKYYIPDPSQEICPIFCKRLFQYRDLANVFDNFMPDLSYICKGLVFYTLNNKFSNYCWIMPREHQIAVRRKHEYQQPITHDDADTDVIGTEYGGIMPTPVVPVDSTYNATGNVDPGNSERVELPRFNIIKTGTPDIYHLFTADNPVDRIGVAFIPNLATSRWLYEHFRDNADRALNTVVECKYHTEFDKWVPITICRPDVSSHRLDELPADLAAVAGPGNSSAEAVEKIKSIASSTVGGTMVMDICSDVVYA